MVAAKVSAMSAHELHWGLQESPFRNSLDPRFFYESPSHEEALARLNFLVENSRRQALLLGASGSGKSLLLELFANRLRRGGTAIATIAPLLRVRPNQIGVALAVVFILNAFALLTFPLIGERLGMSQLEFGLWSALAIHDTSSVVATAAIYGDYAADVATTVKLGRTLWLIPLVFGISLMTHSDDAKLRVPGFIILFVAASAFGSIVTLPEMVLSAVGMLSKSLLVVALFLVGAELSRETLAQIPGRTVLHAVLLWVIVVPVSCFAVLNFA